MKWKKSANTAGRTSPRLRHLTVERLEDRSLLSVTMGLPAAVSSSSLQDLPAFISVANATTTATQLQMSLPRQVTQGVPVQVELLALDSLGNRVLNYAAPVTLRSTDPNVVLPATIAFSQGVSSFPVTFNTPGLQSLAARGNSPIPLNAIVSTTVAQPTAATRFALQLPTPTFGGTPVTVQLTALDSQNRVVPTYAATVRLESSDPRLNAPSAVVFSQGVASFQATFNTPGTQSLTAVDTASALTITANTIVDPPATQLQMSLPRQVTQGVPVQVELLALDRFGNRVLNYAAPVTLRSTDGNIVLPSTIAFSQGVSSFPVTFNTPGLQSLGARDNSPIPLNAIVSTSVSLPLVATHFAVVMPATAVAGAPVTVQLTALDSRNRVVTDYSARVTLSSSDFAAILPSTLAFDQGVATFSVIFNTLGLQILRAMDDSSPPLRLSRGINLLG